MGDRRGACRITIGGPDGKRPLRRPMRRWEDNLKKEIFKTRDRVASSGLICLRIGTGGGDL